MRSAVTAGGLHLVLAGVAVGGAASLVLARFVESLLFGLKPADPIVIGASRGLLLLAAVVAAYIPARRAARLDPMVVLRSP